MAFVIKYVKILRNHWKKSTFAAVCLTYGYNYADDYFQTQELMREYCLKAAKYGQEPLPIDANPRNVTIVLNPNANKRKATKEFEKYCAPILHLAGISVDIIKTESEGHAKKLMETVSGTDAILVAGGDGTLSEVVTGLLRRTGEKTEGLVPLGVLPLGKSNTVATTLFPGGQNLQHIKSLADAALAVVEEHTKLVDVMRIEVTPDEDNINEENESENNNKEDNKNESKTDTNKNKQIMDKNKPVYALSGIKWGAYRDAEVKKDKYWYFGPLRKYATYLFNGYKSSLTWDCKAEIDYYLPCEGCFNCMAPKVEEPRNFFHRLIKGNKSSFPTNINPECKNLYEKLVSTSDLNILTSNVCEGGTIPRLSLNVGPKSVDYLSFVKQGWQSENGEKRDVKEVIEAREIIIKPIVDKTRELWFSIDNENFEVKPIKATLLPKCIKMFYKKNEQ